MDYPHPVDALVSVRMQRNRKVDTKPEIRLRSALHALGLRFRKHHTIRLTGLTVRPDVVFTRQRVAVFVDGCFWHRCPEHGTRPQHNRPYWEAKLERNVRRDAAVDAALREGGWMSLRIWEHEPVNIAAQRVNEALRAPDERPSRRGVEP